MSRTGPLGDDKSALEIIDHMGSDYSVVRAARVSYAKDGQRRKEESDAKLIQYMADHGHGTPFEHTAITFHVSCPLFVRGQWHRHRIGWSYNEISRRYTSDNMEFYFPGVHKWRMQDDKNKQSSSNKLVDVNYGRAQDFTYDSIDKCYNMLRWYNEMVEAGVGREQARMILPQNLYTRFYATCNLRSAAHFINLRADEHAQWEIRQYAESMLEQLRKLYPISIAALCDPKPEPEPEKPWYKKAAKWVWG